MSAVTFKLFMKQVVSAERMNFSGPTSQNNELKITDEKHRHDKLNAVQYLLRSGCMNRLFVTEKIIIIRQQPIYRIYSGIPFRQNAIEDIR